MNIRPWLATGACAAALALVATSGAAASATAVQHAAARTAAPGTVRVKGLHEISNVRLPRTTLPRLSRTDNTLFSSNWSGYTAIAKKNVQVRFISANFNVPSVNCANSPVGTSGLSAVSHWVGLDGLGKVPDGTSSTVEQAGVTGYCTSTTSAPTYYVWYEMYPAAPVTFTGVNPGDALSVSVYLNPSTNVYNLVLTDLTNGGAGFNVDASCASGTKCLNSSAEVISEVPGVSTPD
jgi:Peptidase A4 family